VPAGADYVQMDLMHYEPGDKLTTGRMYLPGYEPDESSGEIAVRHENGVWTANDLPGDRPAVTARSPHDLMAKVAKLYGLPVTNTRLDDERDGAPGQYPARRDVPGAAPKAQPVRPTLSEAVAVDRDLPAAVGDPAKLADARQRMTGLGMGRSEIDYRVGEATVRAAKPAQREDESDWAYSIRTAASRDIARGLLNLLNKDGLRRKAQAEGIVSTARDSKDDLVARLLRVLHDRTADAAAIDRVVSGRTAARSAEVRAQVSATANPPRTNAPAGPAPRPTMTGSQLLAQRRAARNQ
jgi:hypothetical protein